MERSTGTVNRRVGRGSMRARDVRLTRRSMLGLLAGGTATAIAAACGGQAPPAPTTAPTAAPVKPAAAESTKPAAATQAAEPTKPAASAAPATPTPFVAPKRPTPA